jgi:hypothetical protein
VGQPCNLQAPGEFDATDLRQDQIEQAQLRPAGGGNGTGMTAGNDRVALPLEQVLHAQEQRGVVLDNENIRGLVHDATSLFTIAERCRRGYSSDVPT